MWLWGVTLMMSPVIFAAEEASAPEEVSSSEEVSSVEEVTTEIPGNQKDDPELIDNRVQEPALPTPQRPEEKGSAKKEIESPDVFNPSEEISEDFAVAFPVDI